MRSSSFPRGLVFFDSAAKGSARRRRLAFCSLYVIAWLALIWPIYSMVDPVFPLVLGLPVSLAWILLWLALIFAGLLLLFIGDHRENDHSRLEEPEQP